MCLHCLQMPEEGTESRGTGQRVYCELTQGCWGLKGACFLQEPFMRLTPEVSPGLNRDTKEKKTILRGFLGKK